MPRELMEAAAAPAMAPTASVASFSLKFLLRIVRTHGLEVKVIGAWVAWFILRQLQSVFGPRRRCYRNGSVQYPAMAVYYLPTLIAFYAAKEVYSSPDSATKVGLSPGCAFILFLCARGTVTMTVFTLDKGPDRVQNWRLLPWFLYFGWLAIWLDGKLTASDAYSFLLFIVPVLYVLLAKPRAAVLDYETKQFADYMAQHEVLFDGDADNLYKGCRYPFMKLGDNQWKIFSDVQDELPTDDCAVDPADNCLSYIFCRLLARRYFGFPCAEDGNAQVRDFVLTELLADWDKAFTIVQVQLALLHDYFFTNFLSDIDSGLLSGKQAVGEFFLTLLPTVIGVIIYGLYSGQVVRLLVEGVIEGIIVFMIGQPRTPLLPRYWHPIRKLFLYFRKGRYTVGKLPAAPSQSSYYWRDKMGQYSVMEDYDRGLSLKDVLAWFKRRLLSQASYSFIKHHPAENKDVSVSDSIKRFLAHTIKDLNGPPTIGARSLDDFSWSCRQGTLTDTILIWHIATCYCDMSQQPLDEETVPQSLQQNMSQPLEEPSTGYRKVATTLSRYCAYLVAFHPELLPEHSLTVKAVLQQVLQEAKDGLGTTRMTMEEKRVEIQQHQLPEEESSMETLEKGVRLGRQLEQQQDVSLRWKAMADFWAEMILYVAWSSDNAAAHIELLAQGGEFLTHIWALLCNAGMVREQKSTSA